jgi:hypothetical protein
VASIVSADGLPKVSLDFNISYYSHAKFNVLSFPFYFIIFFIHGKGSLDNGYFDNLDKEFSNKFEKKNT